MMRNMRPFFFVAVVASLFQAVAARELLQMDAALGEPVESLPYPCNAYSARGVTEFKRWASDSTFEKKASKHSTEERERFEMRFYVPPGYAVLPHASLTGTGGNAVVEGSGFKNVVRLSVSNSTTNRMWAAACGEWTHVPGGVYLYETMERNSELKMRFFIKKLQKLLETDFDIGNVDVTVKNKLLIQGSNNIINKDGDLTLDKESGKLDVGVQNLIQGYDNQINANVDANAMNRVDSANIPARRSV